MRAIYKLSAYYSSISGTSHAIFIDRLFAGCPELAFEDSPRVRIHFSPLHAPITLFLLLDYLSLFLLALFFVSLLVEEEFVEVAPLHHVLIGAAGQVKTHDAGLLLHA